MKTFLLALALLFSSPVLSQQYVIQVAWEPNPESEDVGWYIAKWANTVTVDNMETITQTSETQFTVDAARFNPVEGGEICIVIVAAKGIERSTPSEKACIIYDTEQFNVSPGQPPSTLSQPSGLTLTLQRR